MTYKGSSSQEHCLLELLRYKQNGYYVELGAFHSNGYTLISRQWHEDWWVDPNAVDQDHFRKFLNWQML